MNYLNTEVATVVRIKCGNPNCTSPSKRFDWDESKHVGPGGGTAKPGERGAVRVTAVCPFCSTENLLWLKDVKKAHRVLRG